ncbi:hypothetical protein PQR62_00655 [Herbaspirillum lusitanum]|uniref:Uncharacterized protein n=1 Tax=Herbaspirillum lusitanum TaxID=213312 RepID=A0ABW9A4S2_9BURK
MQKKTAKKKAILRIAFFMDAARCCAAVFNAVEVVSGFGQHQAGN